MTSLDLQSEPFPPTGGSVAEGIRKQLGRPRMDGLEVLVREAVQNSWDARDGRSPVTFGIRYWRASEQQLEVLKSTIFQRSAPEIEYQPLLESEVGLLAVYDRGTVGLAGPTRADFEPEQGVRTDFIDFLRAVGQPRNMEFGGGTYGYGKAAFYTTSRLRSIVIHSRCEAGDGLEERLMAAALGPSFVLERGDERRRYTGRHWWGRAASDGIVDPVVGAEAGALANALGLPSFSGDGRGTTILVPAPNLGERSADSALDFMRRTLLRYFWPKQFDGVEGNGSMRFEVFLEDREFIVPEADSLPALKPYVEVFSALRDSEGVSAPLGGEVHEIECRRPIQALGTLGLGRFPVSRDPDDQTQGRDRDGDPVDGPSHHTALLRAPNFVVHYLPGPAVPYEGVEYAGVFKSYDQVDAVFAESEPPTHDEWVADSLEDPHHQTYVRTGLRRIKERMREFAAPRIGGDGEGNDLPMGAFSDQLGGLVAELEGTGASVMGGAEAPGGRSGREGTREGSGAGGKRGRAAGAPGKSRARVTIVDEGRVELIDGRPALVVEFDVSVEGRGPVVITANADVLLEGGVSETEPPAGAARPQVIRWTGPEGRRIAEPDCKVSSDLAGRWSVAVAIPDDAMVGVSVVELSAGA